MAFSWLLITHITRVPTTESAGNGGAEVSKWKIKL